VGPEGYSLAQPNILRLPYHGVKMIKHILTLALVLASMLQARDAGRDLRRMLGYTIVASASVERVVAGGSSQRVIVLDNGSAFRVDLLLLNPLPLTDVIVFAKPLAAELRNTYRNTLPESALYSYKVLIDNEAYDASPIN
jgi:hypothetical protein